MRTLRSILLLVSFVSSGPSAIASATAGLSEVQVSGTAANDEFVELYNNGNTAVNLSGWSLRRKGTSDITAKGSSLKTFGGDDAIPAHGYFLWANSASIYRDHADVTTGSSLSDNNSLALYDKDGVLIDSLTWGTGHASPFAPAQFGNPGKSESFARDLASLAWSTTGNVTPTNSKGETSVSESGSTETGSSPYKILINEVLPNPQEKGDAGEFIELYNPSLESIDLSGWEIRDASVTGKYIFPIGTSITALSYLVVTDEEFSLSLNNSNETLSLWDKEKRPVHRVQYEKTKEGISLNLIGSMLRGARKPTPGAANSENRDPTTKERVPKKGYRGFAIEFRARGKDSDGDKLKFIWDFGDGHKSYKENTSHKYLKSGRYTVTLSTDDGIDTAQEKFEIKIEKYRAPNVRIVSLVPNPKGNDSELEWIEIENRERHEVNLRDFSIATGTKKQSITNHPIREDFILPAKSMKRLSREHSLFTLGNERGHIELRSPDGKVLQHLKYKFDKSLADDAVLKKEKGRALAIISALVEPADPQVEAAAPDVASEAKTATATPTGVPEASILPPTEQVEPGEYPSEAIESEKLSWAEVVSYGTPFTLPSSFTPKAHAAKNPPDETAKNEDAPLDWRDRLNVLLNRWLD